MKKERKDPVINDPWPAWPQQSSNRLQANIYRIKPLYRQLLSLGSMRNLWLSIYLLASFTAVWIFFFLFPVAKGLPPFPSQIFLSLLYSLLHPSYLQRWKIQVSQSLEENLNCRFNFLSQISLLSEIFTCSFNPTLLKFYFMKHYSNRY